MHYTDHPVLQMLADEKVLTSEKTERTCDEVFYDYLRTFKDQTNKSYFTLTLIFTILFRECFNFTKINQNGSTTEEYSRLGNADSLPDICNDFVCDLESKNYYCLDSEQDRNEIIEIIQHFCDWLFKNQYTKSKLSLSAEENGN